MHHLLFVLLILLARISVSKVTAAQFNGHCGRLNHPDFTDSGNFKLKYRNSGNAVTASAVECLEYEEHLKNEAVEIRKQIQELELKYVKKIQTIVDLKSGKYSSRKHMTSSFSCDRKTGDWKLNRESAFKCNSRQTTTNSQSNSNSNNKVHILETEKPVPSSVINDANSLSSTTMTHHQTSQTVRKANTDLIVDHLQATSALENYLAESTPEDAEDMMMYGLVFENAEAEPSTSTTKTNNKARAAKIEKVKSNSDCTNDKTSSPINLYTYEAQNATGIYQDNIQVIDNFMNKDFNGHKISGHLKNGDDKSRHLTFYFDQPIEKSETKDLKCSHMEFNLQGSEHTLDGAVFDGEVQLHCWVSSIAETYEEAIYMSMDSMSSSSASSIESSLGVVDNSADSDSIIKIFSFFVDKTSSEITSNNVPSNKLFEAVIKSSIEAAKQQQQGQNNKESDDFNYRVEDITIDLPNVDEYFSYQGSLRTSSGCVSNVSWIVFKQPIIANGSQFRSLDGQNSIKAGYLSGHHVVDAEDRVIRRYAQPVLRSNI
jgi:hypothetical protein